MNDLTRLCNEQLEISGERHVGRRCLEKDIEFIQQQFGLIERERSGKSTIIRYANQTDSIFNQGISTSERKLLQAVSQTFGKMDGVEDFEVLNQLKSSANDQEQPIIIFEKNEDLNGRDLLPKLFRLIERKTTIELKYHRIKDTQKRNKKQIFPHVLKQCKGRWFLFGTTIDTKEVMCYSMDQIEDIKPLPIKYKPYDGRWDEYFESVIGVTKKADDTPQDIVFWASQDECAYLAGKPVHSSMTPLKKNDAELRKRYRLPDDGKLFRINCIVNFELKREMASKFGERIVLEPPSLRKEIINDVKTMLNRYRMITSKRSKFV
ncbi:WYL domain-containing protein [Fibrobacter sp.]|uniref:helix-turn-helix transcriptional regulator n=1 Tax=Fibrobacter sp. TaxID=35828 RepID=UPI0025BEC16F|nr:WYL domain-containing protein [Fibrobacter sp.]MBR4007977.1 WYL domain-containing protein [Fibrobacter sp.]